MITQKNTKGGCEMATRKTKGKIVTFSVEAPTAHRVMLAGTFNNWDYTGTPLKRISKEGIWSKDLNLNPGRYEYKFVVDGSWVNDPRNRNTTRNPYGTENSMVEV